jgi:hypothetical protein
VTTRLRSLRELRGLGVRRSVSRRRKQSSFLAARKEAGLLRFARNDGGDIRAQSHSAIPLEFCNLVALSLTEDAGKAGR